MKQRKIIILSSILFLFLIVWLIFVFPYKLTRVIEFKGLKIGDHCLAFDNIRDDLHKTTNSRPSKFILFIANNKLTDPDSWELDDRKTYGKTTDMILKRGGHFFPCADAKFASLFNIDLILSRTRSPVAFIRDAVERVLWDRNIIKKRSNMWELDASLIAVTDGQGKIMALYKNAKPTDIKRVLDDLKL